MKASQNFLDDYRMPSRMTVMTEPAWRFEDAKDHVQIDLPVLSAGLKASFTGDSVQVRRTDGSGEVLFEVPQLYSTIDPEGSRLEVRSFSNFPVVNGCCTGDGRQILVAPGSQDASTCVSLEEPCTCTL